MILKITNYLKSTLALYTNGHKEICILNVSIEVDFTFWNINKGKLIINSVKKFSKNHGRPRVIFRIVLIHIILLTNKIQEKS